MRTDTPIYDIRLRFDGGDPWGSTMAEAFGIATALYVMGEEVPDHWQFSPGPILNEEIAREQWPDAEWIDALEAGTFTADELRHAGNVLTRYADKLRAAGMDY